MKHSIFALELCVRMRPEVHGVLVDIVRRAPERMSLHDKWLQYSTAAQVLRENLTHAERGCWDYFQDDARAQTDYKMWTDGMMTEEGVRASPSSGAGSADAYRGDPRFLTFTMALLLQQESPSDRWMSGVCEVPEPDLWKRETFAKILAGLAQVSFASVVSDVMYVIPRDDPWGLTEQDLKAEKFAYLRLLSG